MQELYNESIINNEKLINVTLLWEISTVIMYTLKHNKL